MVRNSPRDDEATDQKQRLSVTLPQEYYLQLLELAEKKKVSLAWVVRDAVEIYLSGNNDAEAGRSHK